MSAFDKEAERLRVLVVEDEVLVGLDLVQELEEAGFIVRGPCASSAQAIAEAAAFDPHVAVLDVNLGGGDTSAPLAKRLEAEGKPFVFVTGYAAGAATMMANFPDAARLSKPVDMGTLKRILHDLVA